MNPIASENAQSISTKKHKDSKVFAKKHNESQITTENGGEQEIGELAGELAKVNSKF